MTWTLQKSAIDPYLNICKLSATRDEYFSNFKNHPAYRHVLEHVPYEEGLQYLSEIKINYEDRLEKIKENDLIGSPITFDYDDIGNISPTTIRYIKNVSDIITKFGSNFKTIVEIGGGYGGLCKVLSSFIDFDSYLLVDLEECNLLSRRYLNHFNLPTFSYTSEEIEVHEDFDLFISNYAFSECTRETQLEYIEKFLKKSKYFYMMHNNFHLESGNISHVEFIEIMSEFFEIENYPEHDIERNPQIIYGVKK
jgi:hypothetical protein